MAYCILLKYYMLHQYTRIPRVFVSWYRSVVAQSRRCVSVAYYKHTSIQQKIYVQTFIDDSFISFKALSNRRHFFHVAWFCNLLQHRVIYARESTTPTSRLPLQRELKRVLFDKAFNIKLNWPMIKLKNIICYTS